MTKVYVVVVNWNQWAHTIECLESVLRIDYPRYQVLLCDNGSTDGSVDHIKAWAGGRKPLPLSRNAALMHLVTPPIPKPVPLVELDRSAAESGGGASDAVQPLVLIKNGENLGFAGGTNVGLRYALARGDAEYVWLLNNDTVVAGEALAQLVARMDVCGEAGQCGSTVVSYYRPNSIQARGGCTYNKWWGIVRALGAGEEVGEVVDIGAVERSMSYVHGASLLVRLDFVRTIGLLCEDYFMYFDELDWATRGKDRYALRYAPASLVYHKEGATVGSSSDPRARSLLADVLFVRSRILYTLRFARWALPTIYAGLLGMLINRARRRQWDRISVMVRTALSPRRMPKLGQVSDTI